MDLTQPLTDNDPMPFGTHKGTKMANVPDAYLIWCSTQEWIAEDYPEVWDYIEDNIDVIRNQL